MHFSFGDGNNYSLLGEEDEKTHEELLKIQWLDSFERNNPRIKTMFRDLEKSLNQNLPYNLDIEKFILDYYSLMRTNLTAMNYARSSKIHAALSLFVYSVNHSLEILQEVLRTFKITSIKDGVLNTEYITCYDFLYLKYVNDAFQFLKEHCLMFDEKHPDDFNTQARDLYEKCISAKLYYAKFKNMASDITHYEEELKDTKESFISSQEKRKNYPDETEEIFQMEIGAKDEAPKSQADTKSTLCIT